jgi:hypothetical protein
VTDDKNKKKPETTEGVLRRDRASVKAATQRAKTLAKKAKDPKKK